MFEKWFGGMFGGEGPAPPASWARPTKSPFSIWPEQNTEPISAEPNMLYTIKWSESTEGIKECTPKDPVVMGCHVIEIHPASLGADTISVMDFKGNTFTLPKNEPKAKWCDLSGGKNE